MCPGRAAHRSGNCRRVPKSEAVTAVQRLAVLGRLPLQNSTIGFVSPQSLQLFSPYLPSRIPAHQLPDYLALHSQFIASLAALLYERADERLRVRLEDLVDFVQDVVDILGELRVTLLQITGLVDEFLVDLFALLGGALLPAAVLGRHGDHPHSSRKTDTVRRTDTVVPGRCDASGPYEGTGGHDQTLRRSTDKSRGENRSRGGPPTAFDHSFPRRVRFSPLLLSVLR